MNADKGSRDALVVEPRTTPAPHRRPTQETQPEQTRVRSSSTLWVLAVVLAAAFIALGVWAFSRPAATPERVAPAQVHHDSGITQAVRERNEMFEAHRDSGITQAVRERNDMLEAHRDSGITQALREREQSPPAP